MGILIMNTAITAKVFKMPYSINLSLSAKKSSTVFYQPESILIFKTWIIAAVFS